MRSLAAIAVLAVRCAVRSRVFGAVLAVLLLSVIGLPLTIKGEGTLAGETQVLLRYTLGFVTALLGLATLWTAGASVSREIDERQILLLSSKPVSRGRVWLGKWFGILALDAALLAAAGAGAYGLLAWRLRAPGARVDEVSRLRSEVLVARRSVRPAGRAGAGPIVVAPGQMQHWTFKPGRGLPADETLCLRYRLFSSRRESYAAVKGLWIVGPADAAKRRHIEQTVESGAHTLTFPAGLVDADGTLNVDYANLDDRASAVFEAGDGLEILVREGGFGMNYVRALLVVYCHLAFLAAIGLCAGSLLSLPVAAFVSAAAMGLGAAGNYIRGMAARGVHMSAADEAGGAWFDIVLTAVFKALDVVVSPAARFDALAMLPDGRLVSWLFVGQAFVILVLVYSGAVALLSAWLFGRRELGLAA